MYVVSADFSNPSGSMPSDFIFSTGALFDLAQRNDCAPTQTSLAAIDAASDFLSSVLNKPLARGAKLCP